ncbi:WD_REPEATS_REGION domain-containing protein [Linnemannia exigua]|uniref:WD_REPEATS_REGION domain-containing protein n=1 Tax=Linnemannia exigua TaxID=604196 RepID=A0AAD4DDF4_9FUNG|nr:WD_REPEATS_REGION domain-containing protein [Linnemannia exigua]
MTNPQISSSPAPNARASANKTKASIFSRITSAAKRATSPPAGQRSVSDGIAAVFVEFSKLPVPLGASNHVQQDQNNQRPVTIPTAQVHHDTQPIPVKPNSPKAKVVTPAPKVNLFHVDIFTKNVPKPKAQTTWPRVGARIETTSQLVLCATLLPKDSADDVDVSDDMDVPERVSDEKAFKDAPADWVMAMEQPLKQDLIRTLAEGTVDEFIKDATKNSDTVAEAVLLAPVLGHEYYRNLLDHTIIKFESSPLLDLISLQGLVQVVQSAAPGFLEADDLRRILGIIRERLLSTLQQSTEYVFHLTVAVSRILDVMADNKVSGLERDSEDPFLMYQASYAFQALQYVPHDESNLQVAAKNVAIVVESVVKISGLLKLDFGEFYNGVKGLGAAAGILIESVKTGYEGVCSLIEGGRGVLDSLKEGLGTGHRRQWYLAIRQAEIFKREGCLAELNRLICEAPCRRDPFFQWGICQLLGDLAADSDWDVEKRQQAADFLLALLKDDADWGQDLSVKTWTKTLLERLSKLPINKRTSPRDIIRQDEAVKNHALALLKGIPKADTIGPAFRSLYPLRSRMPVPKSSALLKRVELDVMFDLDNLRDQRLTSLVKAVYIPPLAKANLKASDKDTFPLMSSVKDFLESERQVMLILGDSGSGKSTFNRYLERDLWGSYNPDDEDEPIPLHINLATIDTPEEDLIAKQLSKMHNFPAPKIQELKESRRFILICDGYDETKSTANLYVKNRLNEGVGQWQAKMVISCRSTKIGHDYKSQFMPLPSDTHRGHTTDLFQEAVIAPFTPDQIKGYIEQYVLIDNRPQWDAQNYRNMLNWIPSLKDLVKNPFLLTLALKAMPSLVGAGRSRKDLVQIKVSRLVLFDSVVHQWIIEAEHRLVKSSLSEAEMLVLDDLRQFGFKLKVVEYLKDLATDIFKEQNGSPQVLFSGGPKDDEWKFKYFGRTPKTTVLRLSSPLIRNGIQNSFIHLSVLDYFFARVIYDPEQSNNLALVSHPLAKRSILGDPSILQFLAERVQQEPSKESPFKRQLLMVIENSKMDKSASQAAANAITILVKAGVRFNGADLRGVRIPGADLSTGQFDSAQFQGADLRNVKLNKTWIRQADFSDADMTEVRFGELPHIELTARTSGCSYSPDGETFAVGLHDGSIEIFDTTTWTRIRAFSDPVFASKMTTRDTGDVIDLAYSPTGEYLVTSSEHDKLGVWNYHTGQLCRTLEGHPGGAIAVTVSPDGKQIASTGHDMMVRLWCFQTGELELVLTGHTDLITTVAYSPDGRQVVSGGHEGVIRLWNAQTGDAGVLLVKESFGSVFSVVYSSNGRWIASGHRNNQIQLWNAESGEPGHLLVGNAKSVNDVKFSPDSQWIASAGWDYTVRLWDTETGALFSTLTGHSLFVACVRFSPIKAQFASCGHDRTIRIWELQDLYTSGPSLGVQDLTEPLPFVTYSPSGQHVVSANREGAVYQWDEHSTDPHLLRRAEGSEIQSMAYSPNGLQIASASKSSNDLSVRLWDLVTGEAGLVLTGHEEAAQYLFYSSCSRWIATASDNEQTVNIWDTRAAGSPLVHTFNNHGCGVAFSPDSRRITFGGFDKKLWVRDASTGGLVATLKGHNELISAVTYSPDGSLIGSSSWDCTVRLWDTTTNRPVAILRGHSHWVLCLSFSTCGKWIATGSRDMTVRLWDVQSSLLIASDQINESSGVCVSVVQPFFASVTHVAWNPNGKTEFVSSSAEHAIRAWKVVVVEDRTRDGGQDAGSDVSIAVSVQLDWSSDSNSLVGIGTKTAKAKGLSDFDRALLKQRESAKENRPVGMDEMVI